MEKCNNIKTVLAISGSDPSGGAGLQVDLKVATMLGVFSCSVVTAITAQNTFEVSGIWGVSEKQIRAQLLSVLSDIRPDAVKIGMLTEKGAVEVVAEILRDYNLRNIVVDPILSPTLSKGKHNSDLGAALIKYLFPLSTLVTPNIPEKNAIEELAGRDFGQLCESYLVKGGHSEGDECIDNLYYREERQKEATEDYSPESEEFSYLNVSSSPFPTVEPHPYAAIRFKSSNVDLFKAPLLHKRFANRRITTTNTHGTGCVLSSAIACNLAKGLNLCDAVGAAETFLNNAINKNCDIKLTKGTYGPVLI